jgi:hypothetical protein
MRDAEWFSGAIGFFGGDGMIGQTVVVNEKVFKDLSGEKSRKRGYLVINGYKVYGSKNVGRDELFFPGYER